MSCNTSCLLDYDNAPCISVLAFTDTSIEFNIFFEDPVDLSAGTFSFTLSTDERGDCPVLTVSETPNLIIGADTQVIYPGLFNEETLNGYRVSVFIPKNHGLPFKEYFGQVRHDVDADHGSIILKTTIDIKPSIARL